MYFVVVTETVETVPYELDRYSITTVGARIARQNMNRHRNGRDRSLRIGQVFDYNGMGAHCASENESSPERSRPFPANWIGIRLRR